MWLIIIDSIQELYMNRFNVKISYSFINLCKFFSIHFELLIKVLDVWSCIDATAKIEYVNEFVLEMSSFWFFLCSFEIGFITFALLADSSVAITVVTLIALLVTWKSSMVTREADRLTGFSVGGILTLSFMFPVYDQVISRWIFLGIIFVNYGLIRRKWRSFSLNSW